MEVQLSMTGGPADERGSAITVVIIALFVAVVFTFVGIMLMEHSRASYASKVTGELIGARGKERLIIGVERGGDNTVVSVTNAGSAPSVVRAMLKRGADNSLTANEVASPLGIGVLDNKRIVLGAATPGDVRIGVLTAFGNSFWEGT